ncbi:hypothetical protein AVEN_183751-1, partial [Araneus ventricosus]
MDATNDQISTNKPPLLPKPCLSASSSDPAEHVIPQMVITLPDEEPAVIRNGSQAIPLPYVSISEPVPADSRAKDSKGTPSPTEAVQEQQTTDGKWSGDEQVDSTQNKSIPHDEHVSHSVIQRPLIIESEKCVSQPTTPEPAVQISESPSPPPSLPPTTMQRPLVVEKWSGDEQVDSTQNKSIPHDEHVSHSVIQRPLIIESEKCVSQPTTPEPAVQISESPSPPPSLPPTTMQRPLVVDSSSQITDNFVLASEGTFEQCSPETIHRENIGKDVIEDVEILDDFESSPMDVKPKSSSFSWMPSFSKSHSSGKDEKSSGVQASKETETKDNQKPSDVEPHAKKDGIQQNMKKFFDNLLHDTSSDTKDKTIVQDDHQDGGAMDSKKEQKDGKHGVMKLFSSSKQESETKGKESPLPGELPKETGGTAKESKFTVKKMFDSFKHDTSDKKDAAATELSQPDMKSKGKAMPSSQESPKEPEAISKDTSKDSKFSVKKIFQHDVTGKKDSAAESAKPDTKLKGKISPTSTEPLKDLEPTSKDTSKESKFSVKKMFDSFKHESAEKKETVPESSADVKIKVEVTPPSAESETKAKFNVKKMFDSRKHDSSEKKDVLPDSSTDSKFKEKSTSPTKSPKEGDGSSKYNISKMFDSFKHDSPQKKTDIPSDLSQPNENLPKTPKEGDGSSKYNISKMFDSFKHDSPQKKMDIPSDLSQPNENLPKTPKEGDGSSKYNISKMFDSFKHDSPQKKTDELSESSQPVENLDASKVHKDSKSGFKKFIDSFKHDETVPSTTTGVKLSETPVGSSEYDKKEGSKSALPKPDTSKQYSGKEMQTSQVTITVSPSEKTDTQSKIITAETKDLPEGKLKSKEGSVKKFFHSFKFDGSVAPKEKTKHHVTFLERDSLKRSHSFRDSILLKDEDVPDHSEKVSKGSTHSIRKLFSSDKPSEKKKLKQQLKRSESCKETFAEKEAFHGFRSFFDSITHKNVPKSSQVFTAEEHIYDTVGKPEPSTSGLSYPENISRQTPSKTPEPKQKEDSSGMKRLFDSFRHKDSASKPKVTKREDKDYEKIDISFTVPSASEPSVPLNDKKKDQSTKYLKKEPQLTKSVEAKKKEQTPKDVKKESEPMKIVETKKKDQTTKDVKKEPQPIKSVEIQKSKDVPKVVSNLSPKLAKEKKTEETIPSIQINGPSTSMDSKTSMFTTISDNFTVLKDKVMHSKDSKKKEAVDQEKISEEYDLQHAASKNQVPDISAGTYKPIEDDSFISVDLKQEDDMKKGTTSVTPDKKVSSPEKPIPESSKKPSVPKNLQKSVKASARIEPGTPETLYDTCCMRLANLLGKKAMEIVSEKTKGPPKKPPKPSAEAIARARAAVVSQRLHGYPTKAQSIGENIPVGYDGIRFADDETESSCDYKDIENIDYILDYELVNRYKCDSKLDTFSDPSTCSGMSSYYTPDTVTLKDETFSDAPLETARLNNDYLLEHLSAAANNQTDFRSLPSKVKSKEERDKLKSLAKPGQSVSSTTLTPVKRVPPPLPPKPTVLPKPKDSQNKSGVSQCINGLSLSPRLKTKFEKDSAATKKRPLLVADLKGTEFTSLQTKSKDHQNKERTFNTVLRNESLKNISTIAPLHKPLKSTKSSPHISQSSATSEPAASKKQTPQRPPPPISSIHAEEKRPRAPPPVPEKPKREGRTASTSAIPEKRTISPPRPPPPVVTKVNVPPPRPPPPTPSKTVTDKRINDQAETSNIFKTDAPMVSEKDLSNDRPIYENDTQQRKLSEIAHPDYPFEKKEAITDDQSKHRPDESLNVLAKKNDLIPESSEEISEIKTSDLATVTVDAAVVKPAPKPPPRGRRIRSRTVEIPPKEKTPEKSLRRSQSLSDIEVESRTSHLTVSTPPTKTDLKHLYTSVNKDGKRAVASGSQSPSVSSRPLPAPPPPPRKFRSLDRKAKDKKKQAEKDGMKSSEDDVLMPRSASADAAVVHGPKDTEKQIESTLETSGSLSPLPISCSPDMSPDRKSRDELKETDSFKLSESGSPVPRSDSPNVSVKPPERKRKTEKQRFLSLHTEIKRTTPEFETHSLRMPRSHSEPLKPDRKFKHLHRPEYDENANISFPTVAEVHHSSVILDECGNEIGETSASANIPPVDATDSATSDGKDNKNPNPHPRRKKDKNPKKSHSSWYDQSEQSWEIVDWDSVAASEKDFRTPETSGSLAQMRRRSDPIIGRKIRQPSKFYVDVEVGSAGLPLVDKETSPLHLDCSEKSVQTSLETLSQGIISHDEQSELAESSSDNTDNLLNIVKTLQSELKTTLSRHKSLEDEDKDTSNAATDTEMKDEGRKKEYLNTPSIQSSASETWPISSSEESEGELSSGRAASLSEIALNRKKKKVFYIAREIMTSEEIFVDTLKLLNVDFKAAVEAASKQRNSPVIPDEALSQILNHLPQLQQLNENLLMELKDRIDN